ncbi:glycosyltransferase family 39 protein [Bradyrhizobium sp. CCBAU 51753]|uniref:ArnT family glycosyltransferase n=1 Tax=Bradyrhizobium sp. CCBAU 51753 TaxID=1325100 RepID=UPI00188D501B|nr:hypothetical protein [Bradyrhizobium sp. CCBAU 51753]QOZ27238.1 hypothetical protein XH93_29205 [Bradyrhizobium sp. CCBAU 51753]
MDVSKGKMRYRAAGVGILLAILLCWIALSVAAALREGTWPDETAYIIKSWWYVSGAVKPYTAEDTTWYQPLIYYVMGPWQWMFGPGVVSARLLSVLITAIDIALLGYLLRRLGCTAWPIAFAVVVFVLSEDGIFYFSSATPYAYFVCVQLIALHLLLGMHRQASLATAIALGAVLTMAYLLRINAVAFIALSLGIAWVRAGRDRWRVYFCSAAIFLTTWSLLALLWGPRFVYVTLWLPGMTDWLIQAGVLPNLYSFALSHSSQALGVPHPSTLRDMLAYAFGWDIMGHYLLNHHGVPLASALAATIVAALRPIPNRGWTALFAASYWALLVFHHLGLQSICPTCIQAYANYVDYLAALAGGLALHGLMRTASNDRLAGGIAVGTIFASLALAAVQAWNLVGPYQLPSIRNRVSSLPEEVRLAGETMRTLLPPGTKAEFVGSDLRIPLALVQAGIQIPPITLTLPSNYRKLNEGLTPEQVAQATAEMKQLTGWTDTIAKQWMQESGDWLILQRRPVVAAPDWLIWAPDAALVKTGLEKCFERVSESTFDTFVPPLSIALYRRVRRGKTCLGE